MIRPDIALVKPGSQKQLYGELSAFSLTGIEPPLWAALLAAFLRDKGYAVELLDAEVLGLSHEQTARRLADIKPHLAAVVVSGTNPSASTMNMTGAGAILKNLRQDAPGIKSLLMGLHPSALPGRTLDEEPCDFVCQGEGFYTLPALIEAIKAGATPSDIPGLWRREDGKAVPAERPPLFKDLDALPTAAWDLLPLENYRAHNWHCFDAIESRSPYAVLYTSLGCPFSCSFCCINALFGKPGFRTRSPKSVAAEVDYLVTRHGVRNIKILDEMFAVNEKRVLEVCAAISELGHDLNFWAYARVNTVTPAMLAAMKRAGINWVAYGFESASKRVLADVAKGYDPGAVAGVVRQTKDFGLNICANFIFGLPEDDYDSMQETLSLMQDINAPWANIYSAMAYPGSKLHEWAVKENLPLPESWQGYSQYSFDSLPLPTKHLSGGQVLAFRDYAFNAYHQNPRYLDSLRAAFGPATAEHVALMAAKKLTRKHAQPFTGARPGL